MDDLKLLERRLAREKSARKQAEDLIEQKSRDIYHANQELERFNAELEERVEAQRIIERFYHSHHDEVSRSYESSVPIESTRNQVDGANRNPDRVRRRSGSFPGRRPRCDRAQENRGSPAGQ